MKKSCVSANQTIVILKGAEAGILAPASCREFGKNSRPLLS